MRKTLVAITFAGFAFTLPAFANATVSVVCSPTPGSNAFAVGNALHFTQGSGNGSFTCSDASLALPPGSLLGISVSIFTDYNFGNGNSGDPTDNSAGFTFTNSQTTWANAQQGAFTSTMSLNTGSGVTLFTIGNLSSTANTFTNTTSGGLGGTAYLLPTTDVVTGTLLDTIVINEVAFVDAGGFFNGDSSTRITINFTITPEPVSISLAAVGLLTLAILRRKKIRI